MSVVLLRALERIHRHYGAGAAERKLALLARLSRTPLRSPASVRRLHEIACFLQAYPDNRAVLSSVEGMLATFAERRDLRRHAPALADSGIAGTSIRYSFYFEMAQWLAGRWPQELTVLWDDVEATDRLDAALALLVPIAEHPALDALVLTVDEWVRRLKGPDEGDGAFLVRRFAALPAGTFVRQFLYEDLDLWMRLAPGTETPARTRAKLPRRRMHWQRGPVSGPRPDLLAALRDPPSPVHLVSRREGERLIDAARAAMVTRGRDLDVFAYGDPDDVRLVDCGDGLEFAVIGQRPERRLMLEAVYGFLTLKNGVPVGYVLNSALFGSAEIAYNVFDTFRGAEAAHIYACVLATVRQLFGADTFCIFPYQLGHENDEALASGAWWFYQKLGFRARDRSVLALMRRELGRMRERPGHRSSIATLRQLAGETVYLQTGRQRDDVIGVLPMASVGAAVSERLARRFGADRDEGVRACAREAMARLGLRSLRGFSAHERLWWNRWAPLVVTLPGLARWREADRRALVAVIRAKGGRHESEFVRAFDAHRPLRRALVALARRAPAG